MKNGRREAVRLHVASLPAGENERHLHVETRDDWLPVRGKWRVSPLFHSLDRGRRQQARATDQRRCPDGAIARDGDAKSHRAVNAGSQRAGRIDGLRPLDHVTGRIRGADFDHALASLLPYRAGGSESCEKSQGEGVDHRRYERIIPAESNSGFDDVT